MWLLHVAFGAIVGLSLGLTGGGGAIFAVPLLVFGVGLDPAQAVGVSLVTIGATALVGSLQRLRYGLVEARTGLLFALAGMLTAPLGAKVADRLPAPLLLTLFAALMLVIALRMWRTADRTRGTIALNEALNEPGPTCHRDPQGVLRMTSRCAILLGSVGLLVGFLTGLFGVGGGFLIVPALVAFSGMGIQRAVGTSLFIMTLVTASGAAAHFMSGKTIACDVTVEFVCGAMGGLFLGSAFARKLAGPPLQKIFAAAIVAVACFVIFRSSLL
jgi:uncharacterized protein